MPLKNSYIAIDLKSFYASVECVEAGLDPLDACLVVADRSRTDKTICLAVSPALKSFGVGGRPRLFEVVSRVREVNRGHGRAGSSRSGRELAANPNLALDFHVAKPRMALYLKYSRRIYNIYMKYVAPEDIHVYSVDEVFIDATPYLSTYGMTAHELAMTMIRDVLAQTGITATAGIGTNLYLCKVAMDIVAKKMGPDSDGVRIAELDEMSYRRQLWDHYPLTDFWRVGRGTARKLAAYGIATMGDIARCSIHREELLYRLFGVNAELLIDHAWGWEPVTMDLVKAYRPETHSISSGQVLTSPYSAQMARTVVLEMADAMSLELIDKRLLTKKVTLEVGYDAESLTNPEIRAAYDGRTHTDRYGRTVPFHAHGTANLEAWSSASSRLSSAFGQLFDRIVNPVLLIRRLTLTACELTAEPPETTASAPEAQPDLFTDFEQLKREQEQRRVESERERRRQEAILKIKKRFGKNSILTGLNFAEGATQKSRNTQIGGHHE